MIDSCINLTRQQFSTYNFGGVEGFSHVHILLRVWKVFYGIPFRTPHLTSPPSLEINDCSLTTELNVFSGIMLSLLDMVDPDAGVLFEKSC